MPDILLTFNNSFPDLTKAVSRMPVRGKTPSTDPNATTSNPARGSAYAWYVVAIVTLANVCGFVDRQILGVLVKPIQRDFAITDVQISYLGGAFAVFFAVMGLPIARWADRYSRRNIIGVGVATWSVFTALCATARTYARLFVLRIGVGVGEATLSAPGISLIADYFAREQLGRAMSVYALGSFVGSGVGYFIGGWVVQLAGVRASWTVPLIGTIRPWQSAFLVVGLPGLLVALLFLTVREPVRRSRTSDLPSGESEARPSIGVLLRYVTRNRRTYLTHGLGFTLFFLVNLGIAFWLPEFFRRTYGWRPEDASKIQGILTMTIGVAGVLAGGWVSDRYLKRGQTDGPLRVALIGAAGMLISATAYPFMSSATLAVAGLGVVNFFAAFPWGGAWAAAAEMAPPPLRAQSVSLFLFVFTLVAGTFGPMSVALLNDHVFNTASGIRYSLATVTAVAMSLALLLFAAGLGSYRRTLEVRDRWMLES